MEFHEDDLLNLATTKTTNDTNFTVEFTSISTLSNLICLFVNFSIMWNLISAIRSAKTNTALISVKLYKISLALALALTSYVIVLLMFILISQVRSFSLNALLALDGLLDFCVLVCLMLWIYMWQEVIVVFIKKKFIRVRFASDTKGAIKQKLKSRIQNITGE